MSDPGEAVDTAEVDDVEAVEIEQEVDETDAGDADEAEEDSTEDGAEEAPAEGGEAPAVAAKPRSAATIAVQEAKRARKAAEDKAADLERRLNDQERQRQGQLTAQQQAEERARLELMAPDEKTDYLLNKQRQEFSGAINQLRFEQADNADRLAFENLCARNPSLAAVRDEAEQKLVEMRRNGANANREVVATFLLGQRALKRAEKGGKAKQAAKGASRVQSQRVAAPSGRSDVRGGDQRKGGGDTAAARKARLENQLI